MKFFLSHYLDPSGQRWDTMKCAFLPPFFSWLDVIIIGFSFGFWRIKRSLKRFWYFFFCRSVLSDRKIYRVIDTTQFHKRLSYCLVSPGVIFCKTMMRGQHLLTGALWWSTPWCEGRRSQIIIPNDSNDHRHVDDSEGRGEAYRSFGLRSSNVSLSLLNFFLCFLYWSHVERNLRWEKKERGEKAFW